MATIGIIEIALRASTDGLIGGIGKGTKALGDFAKGGASKLGDLTGHVTGLQGAIAGLAGAFTLSAGVKTVADHLKSIDETADLAQRLGTTTEALSQLRYATQLTGSEGENLDGALQKMSGNLGDAAAKGGPAADALRRLGLDAKQLVSLDPAEAFKQIAGGISKLENPADRAAAALDIFGKQGASLLNTLSAGPEQIAELEKEAKALGVSFSAVDAAKVGAANDALDRAGYAIAGLGNSLAVELAPFIEAAAKAFGDLATSGGGASSYITIAIEGVATGIGIAADVLQALRIGFLFLRSGATAAIAVVVDAIGMLGRAIESVVNLLPGVHATFGSTITAIGEDLHKLAGRQLGEAMDALAAPAASDRVKAAFEGIRSGAAAAAAEATKASDATKGLIGSTIQLRDEITKLEDKLKAQVAAFGKSASEAEVLALAEKGAGAADLAKARGLADQLKALEKAKEAKDKLDALGKDLADKLANPLDKFAEKVEAINQLWAAGKLNVEQYRNAIALAGKESGVSDVGKRSGAMDLGSAEARTAILQFRSRGETQDPTRQLQRIGERQLAKQGEAVEQFRTVAAATTQLVELAKKAPLF